MGVTKNRLPLKKLEDWEQHAGPKRRSQWKEGRSAMEAARIWLSVSSPDLPRQVASTLASHPDFGPVLAWSAEPEVRLSFDGLRGEPRNTDLLLSGRDARGEFLIAVEAKADESFGQTVSSAAAAAERRLQQNARSGGVTRISNLLTLLFGASLDTEPSLGKLRYQLLTATAGALAASRNAGDQRVVLLVQEFRTNATSGHRHVRNGAELDAFVERLSGGRVPDVKAGSLHGPFMFATAARSGPFYIGKVVHDLR